MLGSSCGIASWRAGGVVEIEKGHGLVQRVEAGFVAGSSQAGVDGPLGDLHLQKE